MAPDLRRNQHKSRSNTCTDDVVDDEEEEEEDAVGAGPVRTSGASNSPPVRDAGHSADSSRGFNNLIIKAHYVLCFR